jgi:hypothetical protein
MLPRFVMIAVTAIVMVCQAQEAPWRTEYLKEGQVLEAGVNPEAMEAEGAVVELGEVGEDAASIGHRNGKWVVGLRVSSTGAQGLQFLFQNVRLPAGARLLLWEMDGLGMPSVLRASYEGAGPTQDGEFWSDAVTGAEALIEVEYGDGEAADLPFRLASVRHLNAAGLRAMTERAVQELPERPELEGTTGTAMFRGEPVNYVVRNGFAVFEGDILLGRVGELELPQGKEKMSHRSAMGLTNTAYRWPGGVVPYTIDSDIPSQSRITSAIAHWNNSLGGRITLVARTTETNFLRFVRPASPGTCSSYVGYVAMANQPVNIGDYCSAGSVIHEIGHAVGLFHEHTREDRDTYVEIVWGNISSGMSGNFAQQIASSDDIGAYDYSSIMHYPTHGFSSNGSPTIITKPPGISIGQRSALSAGDIAGASYMYGGSAPAPAPAPAAPKVTVTFATSPPGQKLVVDGVTVSTPKALQWSVGTTYTISAPNVTQGTIKYVFSKWSDGGAQEHTVTASKAVTLTATFSNHFKLTVKSSSASLGTVEASPASDDSFYAAGSKLTLSAEAATGACFARWSGVAAPPAATVKVTVSQPATIIGNFNNGAVTVSAPTVAVTAAAASKTVGITTTPGCPWTASTSTDWITLATTSGTGSGALRFSVTQNTTNRPRTGKITIGRTTVTVQQAAATN